MISILLEYLRNNNPVVIYGGGHNGTILQRIFDKNDVKVTYFCDSNEKKWGKLINGIECISFDELIKMSEAVVIVATVRYPEIVSMLRPYTFKKVLTWDDVKFLKESLNKMEWDELCGRDNKELLDKLKSNSRFQNIHNGKRCFIVGNGPSVREQNLSLLKNEYTFTVNQMARSNKFKDIQTNFHLWADPNFFNLDFSCEGDYQLLEVMKSLPKDVECFFPYMCAHEYVERYELDKYINVNYYLQSKDISEKIPIDFTSYIRSGNTVVQYAIRLAIYMGFTKIYLLGCECSTILNVINSRMAEYTYVTHCYDIGEQEKVRAKKMYEKLPMQSYYRVELGVLEEYRILKEYCDDREIELYNCTPGGLLEELPRCCYEDVVSTRMRD